MRFRGLAYRAHNPQWSWMPLSGEGARRYGGRFNRRGFPALNTSLTPLTLIREAQPLTLCACEVDTEPVFDTLDGERRRALGVLDSHLACLASPGKPKCSQAVSLHRRPWRVA